MNSVDELRGAYSIYHHNDYVILLGSNLLIFDTNGKLIRARKDIKNVKKVQFLSKARILVDCGLQEAYIMLSLIDGTELWRVKQPRLDLTGHRFAVTPDESYAYDIYDLYERYYLVKIDLENYTIVKHKLDPALRTIRDIMCNENGELCLLVTHYDDSGEQAKSINAVQIVSEGGNAADKLIKYCWEFAFPRIAGFFFDSTKEILTQDLHIYETHSGKCLNLLENEKDLTISYRSPSYFNLNATKRYATFMYMHKNIVVDITQRKIVAQYAAEYKKGCKVGEEFWVCSDDRVLRKPFPAIEDIPPSKPHFWSPWHM